MNSTIQRSPEGRRYASEQEYLEDEYSRLKISENNLNSFIENTMVPL